MRESFDNLAVTRARYESVKKRGQRLVWYGANRIQMVSTLRMVRKASVIATCSLRYVFRDFGEKKLEQCVVFHWSNVIRVLPLAQLPSGIRFRLKPAIFLSILSE